jgi:hypothetical protein
VRQGSRHNSLPLWLCRHARSWPHMCAVALRLPLLPVGAVIAAIAGAPCVSSSFTQGLACLAPVFLQRVYSEGTVVTWRRGIENPIRRHGSSEARRVIPQRDTFTAIS